MSDFIRPVAPIITGNPSTTPVREPQTTKTGQSFQEILQRSIAANDSDRLVFSKHAMSRTAQRGINLTGSDLERLSSAVELAQDKGLTDTLVLMDNNAFIVNVPARVVITVVEGGDRDNNVFTNIDGAVIV